MTGPSLTASERAAIREAKSMEREIYATGSVVARDGKTYLFAAGSAAAFGELWRQAEALRAEANQCD
jgi:hypothetical protein